MKCMKNKDETKDCRLISRNDFAIKRTILLTSFVSIYPRLYNFGEHAMREKSEYIFYRIIQQIEHWPDELVGAN